MTLNYTTFVSRLADLLQYTSTEPNFPTFLNGAIDYGEQRIYREADFLSEQVVDETAQLSSGVRSFTLPTTFGTFVVVDSINVVTPAGSNSSVGVLNQLQPVSRGYLDAVYTTGLSSATGQPLFFAPITATSYQVGPVPDAPYFISVTGLQRPTPLSSGNSSTFLTQYCPDLFIAACMVYGAGYQRDFGSQSDDPARAQSWENQYKQLFQSVNVEEFRRKFQSQGWSAKQPNTIATPPRT